MGYPGQFEHEYQDAQTLASWGVDFWKYDQCWHKIPLIDTLAIEAYSGSLPTTVGVSNSNSLGMNVRGMSAHGQDADFAGDRIRHFTNSSETGFVGPQISIASMPASWDVAETWDGSAGEGGIPGTQIQYYEAYRLFGEALKSTGRNITYSICPFIAGCDESIWRTPLHNYPCEGFIILIARPIAVGRLLQEFFAHEHESVPGARRDG